MMGKEDNLASYIYPILLHGFPAFSVKRFAFRKFKKISDFPETRF